MKIASIIFILLGLVSLGLSTVWTKIAPKPAAMSPEQEEKYLQVLGDLHQAPTRDVSAESKAFLEEVERSNIQVENIDRLAIVFRFGGVALALIGVTLFFWMNSTEG